MLDGALQRFLCQLTQKWIVLGGVQLASTIVDLLLAPARLAERLGDDFRGGDRTATAAPHVALLHVEPLIVVEHVLAGHVANVHGVVAGVASKVKRCRHLGGLPIEDLQAT
jgi:hypothetical protein